MTLWRPLNKGESELVTEFPAQIIPVIILAIYVPSVSTTIGGINHATGNELREAVAGIQFTFDALPFADRAANPRHKGEADPQAVARKAERTFDKRTGKTFHSSPAAPPNPLPKESRQSNVYNRDG